MINVPISNEAFGSFWLERRNFSALFGHFLITVDLFLSKYIDNIVNVYTQFITKITEFTDWIIAAVYHEYSIKLRSLYQNQ